MDGTLLAALISPDNTARRAAEATYKQQRDTQPETVAQALLAAVGSPQLPAHLRSLAAVLVRRLISGHLSSWDRMGGQAKDFVRGELLRMITEEPDDQLRKKICHATCDLAKDLLESSQEANPWPGLLPALLALVDHPQPSQREAALHILAPVAEGAFELLAPGMGTVLQVLSNRLGDTIAVRFAAMKTIAAILTNVEDSQYGNYQSLLAPILTATSDPVAMADPASESTTKEILELLTELVAYLPRFFRPAISEYARFFVSLAAADAAPASYRFLALEWIVTLAESRPQLARKVTVGLGDGGNSGSAALTRCAMEVCFGMMLKVEDDPAWASAQDEEPDPDDVRAEFVGAGALDRLAIAFGAKTSLPIAFAIANNFLSRETNSTSSSSSAAAASGNVLMLPIAANVQEGGWKFAYAALWALCQVVEAGKDSPNANQMQQQVVTIAVQYLGHQNPRVRYMALQTLGQLLLDHGPDVQNNHYQTLVPALLASMDHAHNPSARVRSHACAATINFVDFLEPVLLAPYLDSVLSAALGVIRTGPRIAQEQAVALVSSACMVMEDQLGDKQYSMLMPFFKQALGQCPNEDEFRMLKGRFLECISLLGASVHSERFKEDVLPVMQAMAQATNGQGMDADDPTKQFILKAWVRISKSLGEAFAPYLEIVMAPLLAVLEQPVETVMTPEQVQQAEEEEDDDEEDETVVTQNEEGQFVQVNTSYLEEQASAAHHVLLLAEAMGPHFAPYVERCARSLATLAVRSVHDDVRSYSLAALPELMTAAARALALALPDEAAPAAVAAAAQATATATAPGQTATLSSARWQPLSSMLRFFVQQLLTSVEGESEMELSMTALQSLKACVENACRTDWSTSAAPGLAGQAATALATYRAQQSRSPLVPAASCALLAADQMGAVSELLLRLLQISIQRRAVARAEAQTDEDYDEEQQEVDQAKGAEEEELQFNIGEVLGAILKTHGYRFLPILTEQWMDRLQDMSDARCLTSDRKIAAYIYCDVVEHCGESVAPVLGRVMPGLLEGLASEEPTLRQPCAYGLAVAAAHCPRALAASSGTATPWLDESLRRLVAAASSPGARQGSQESATDNVVAAVGSFCVHLGHHPALAGNLGEFWDQYLAYLPMRGDREESRKAVLQLCTLTARGDEGLLGPNRQRLPRIWQLVSSAAVADDAGAPPLRRAVEETARALAAKLPAEEMQSLWQHNTDPRAAQELQKNLR